MWWSSFWSGRDAVGRGRAGSVVSVLLVGFQVAERAECSPSDFAGVAVIRASEIALDWREGRGSSLVDVEDLDRARGAYMDRLDSECVDVLGIDPLDSPVKVGVFCLFCFRLGWRSLRLSCSSASCMVALFSAVPRRIVLRACSPRFAVSRASSRTWVCVFFCFVRCLLGCEPIGSASRAAIAARLDSF